MFIDPKTSKATRKKSERDLLLNAASLLKQIGKFSGVKAADEAVQAIEVTLGEIEPKAEK